MHQQLIKGTPTTDQMHTNNWTKMHQQLYKNEANSEYSRKHEEKATYRI